MRLIIFDEVVSFFTSDALDVADFVAELNAVVFIGMFEQFRPESGGDELGVFGQFVYHVGHTFTMLGVKGLEQK